MSADCTQVEPFHTPGSLQRRKGDEKTPRSSRKPANTGFQQQRLKAWQPILEPCFVLPFLFIISIIFTPLGGILIWSSIEVEEITIDYTGCATKAPPAPSTAAITDRVVSSFTQTSIPTWQRKFNTTTNTTTCSLIFDVSITLSPPVFLYYRLTNLYQNQRQYVNSFSRDQLKGIAVSNETIAKSASSSSCARLGIDPETGKAYYPCGLIANSIFNDTYANPELINIGMYNMTDKGIAWPIDKTRIQKTSYQPWQVVPPPNWRKRYPHGYTEEHPIPDLGEDEGFMVWTRTAAFPSLRKLAKRNDNESMAKGTYRLDIEDRYPIAEYGGTKSIVISTSNSVFGARNPAIGVAFLITGGICAVLGGVFAAVHVLKPRKIGDMASLKWNHESPDGLESLIRQIAF